MTKIITISIVDQVKSDIIIPVIAFITPFIIAGPQWLTGTIVNCLLFLSANKLAKTSRLLVVILPSVGAFLRGVIFGPLTFFLLYFLPFIWLSNYLLIAIFNQLTGNNYLLRVFIAAISKFVLLFLVANLYFKAHIIPQLFLNSMGGLQFITAFSGGILAWLLTRLNQKNE